MSTQVSTASRGKVMSQELETKIKALETRVELLEAYINVILSTPPATPIYYPPPPPAVYPQYTSPYYYTPAVYPQYTSPYCTPIQYLPT
jgi:hypothetical protein